MQDNTPKKDPPVFIITDEYPKLVPLMKHKLLTCSILPWCINELQKLKPPVDALFVLPDEVPGEEKPGQKLE